MKFYSELGFLIIILHIFTITSQNTSTDSKKKLQIGIKKRIDHCTRKSIKGDLLHMHYTVSKLLN